MGELMHRAMWRILDCCTRNWSLGKGTLSLCHRKCHFELVTCLLRYSFKPRLRAWVVWWREGDFSWKQKSNMIEREGGGGGKGGHLPLRASKSSEILGVCVCSLQRPHLTSFQNSSPLLRFRPQLREGGLQCSSNLSSRDTNSVDTAIVSLWQQHQLRASTTKHSAASDTLMSQ